MKGFVTETEVGIWIQTDEPSKVKLIMGENDGRFINPPETMKVIETVLENRFIARFKVSNLKSGTGYAYGFEINGQEPEKFHIIRTKSRYKKEQPNDFSLAFGSCADFDPPRTTEEEGSSLVFESIPLSSPTLMIWLGDNIYFKKEDFGSRENMFKRYQISRSRPYMQDLLKGAHHYAIWDDHDFGPNNSNSSYEYKNHSLEAFNLYWMNENQIFPGEGITSTFSYEDADFFLLDNRSWRIVDEENPDNNTIWGSRQMDWLKDQLKSSEAIFKIICTGGQFLSDAAVHENHANVAPVERQELLDFLKDEGIGGIVFLTGDRHSSELSMETIGNRKAYDWTISPMRANAYDHTDEPNTKRIKGSMFAQHMFGFIEFQGQFGSRELKLTAYDRSGNELWNYVINQEDLY